MRKTRAAFPRPLDRIFSAPSHIAVLRALFGSKDGMSARAAARAGGVNHQAGAMALRRLQELGIIERLGSGRVQLLRLDRGAPLVRTALLPLLRGEDRLVRRLVSRVLESAKRWALSATAAPGPEGKSFPACVCGFLILVPPRAKRRALREARSLSRSLARESGIKMKALILTPRECRDRLEARDPFIQGALAAGKDILGKSLKETLSPGSRQTR